MTHNQGDSYQVIVVAKGARGDPWDQRFSNASGDHVLHEFSTSWRSGVFFQQIGSLKDRRYIRVGTGTVLLFSDRRARSHVFIGAIGRNVPGIRRGSSPGYVASGSFV